MQRVRHRESQHSQGLSLRVAETTERRRGKNGGAYFATDEERQEFLEAVKNSTPEDSPRELLSGPLKVSTLEFSSISRILPQPDGKLPRPAGSRGRSKAELPAGLEQGFVDAVFLRFLRLSGMEWSSIQREFSGNVIMELLNKKIHIALSYFTSINRAFHVRFWPLPIRLTLGALYRSEFNEFGRIDEFNKSSKAIQQALKYSPSRLREKTVVPVVLQDSAAYMHCKFTLGYTDAEMEPVQRRDFAQYDEAWKKASQKFSGRRAIIVDDELNLAEMLAATDSNGALLYANYVPALPLTSPHTAREDDFKRESPIYFVSLACSRKNQEVWNFLDEGMRILLLSEVFTTSEAYVKLYLDLLETLKKALLRYRTKDGKLPELGTAKADIFAGAHQWAMHTLHLTTFAIGQFTEAYPHWKSILTRARSRVLQTLAGEDPHAGLPDYKTDIIHLVNTERPGRRRYRNPHDREGTGPESAADAMGPQVCRGQPGRPERYRSSESPRRRGRP